jgi:hypothetical protein
MSVVLGARDRFSRRHLLRAMGSTLLIPLWARRALAAPPEPRLVLIMQTNGTSQPNFWPTATSYRSTILDPLLADPKLASKTTVVKGLFNDQLTGNGHDDGWSGMWSGYRCPVERINGGISIDQFLKQKGKANAPFPTLACGVANGTGMRSSFSYLGRGQVVPANNNVYELYSTMFGATAGPSPMAPPAASVRADRSILDYVAKDLTTLSGRLGPTERAKLEQHATALRQFESRLSGATTTPVAGCGNVVAPTPPVSAKGLSGYLRSESQAGALAPLFADLIALAVGCNLTRIVTFQIMFAGNHGAFPWLSMPKDFDYHFDCAHRDSQQGNPAVTPYAVKVSHWYAEIIASIAKKMDQMPDGNGTVLDNSLIAWANDMGSGDHKYTNIPLVFIGSAGGRLKKTGVLVDQGPQDYHRAGATVLNLMGYPSSGFGEARDCGTLAGVAL